MELAPRVDSKSNELLISALVENLKAKSGTALKVYKELQREEKAQVSILLLQSSLSLSLSQAKDADAAAGRKSGGFCGGSTKGVHDPSKEPQAAPSQTPNSEPLKNELPHGQDPSSDAAAKNLPPPKVQKMLSERRFSDVVDFPQIHPVTPWTP
jgi:hypothetical protein